MMKKLLFSMVALIGLQLHAQTTFDWENASNNGTSITQTVDEITATFEVSSNNPFLADAEGFRGTSGFVIRSRFGTSDNSAIITFSSPVDIESIFAVNGHGTQEGFTWTFTPGSGTNDVVQSNISGSVGSTVTLNWTNVTDILITSSKGNDWFVFDNIILSEGRTYVPDDNFEQALIDLGYDSGALDDYVPTSNIKEVTSLNLFNKSISNLTGIEAFKELTVLNCNNNQLTSIDLSQNEKLQTLHIRSNELTSIDISQNTGLEVLNIGGNQLTSLDVSKNTALLQLSCWENLITSLDLSNNTLITEIHCANNPINTMDISKNVALKILFCYSTQLTSLDTSQNTVLEALYCYWSNITELDLSKNTALRTLQAQGNSLTQLNLRNGNNNFLTQMIATENNLSCIAIDDSSMINLSWDIDNNASYSENCHYNETYVPDDNFEQALINLGYDTGALDDYVPTANIENVTTLDLSNKNISDLTGIRDFTALIFLNGNDNQLTNIDLSQNILLQTLWLGNNQLSSLDVSHNASLIRLYSFNNPISTLDVSQNTALEILNCSSNQLTSLNVSQNTELINLNCSKNELTSIDVSLNDKLESLHVGENSLTNIDLAQNINLGILSIGKNQLTDLDVSNNRLLETLNCFYNDITQIDIAKNLRLINLNCSDNLLTNLDISTNLLLRTLYCGVNQLSNLDISNHELLTQVSCRENQLTELNLKNGNNTKMVTMDALQNPSLGCIRVDDAAAERSPGWTKDATAFYSENCATLGNEDFDNGLALELYPNPNNGTFTINSREIITDITMYTLQGRKIKSIAPNQSNISLIEDTLTTGIYFVHIQGATKNTVKRVIIK